MRYPIWVVAVPLLLLAGDGSAQSAVEPDALNRLEFLLGRSGGHD
jgi:hypothetical protein